MRTRTIVIGVIAVVILAVLAIVLIPKLIKPEQVSTQTYWPTQGWQTSTPEEQGLDSAKLAEVLAGDPETKHQDRQPAGHSQRFSVAGCLLL